GASKPTCPRPRRGEGIFLFGRDRWVRGSAFLGECTPRACIALVKSRCPLPMGEGTSGADAPLRRRLLGIEAHDPAFEAWLGGRIARKHSRVVAWHHALARAGEPLERDVALQHF